MDYNDLKKYWDNYRVLSKTWETADLSSIELFESEYGLVIPEDLRAYFLNLNGNGENWDGCMNEFYPFHKFVTVKDELGDYGGVPDYREIVYTLPDHQNCFVFGDHSLHLITFAIRLYPNAGRVNEVYAICGSSFRLIAISFNGFIEKYFHEDMDIYI